MGKITSLILLIASLSCSVMGQDVPFYTTTSDKTQDIGAVNQNFRDLVDNKDLLSDGEVPNEYQQCIFSPMFCVNQYDKRIAIVDTSIFLSSTTGGSYGICFADGSCQTSAGVGSSAISANAFQFTGNGTLASPLALNTSSVTLQGNTFNVASKLLKLDTAGKVPVANLPTDPYSGVYVKTTGDTMTGQLTMSGSSIAFVNPGSITGVKLVSASSILVDSISASEYWGDISSTTGYNQTHKLLYSTSGDPTGFVDRNAVISFNDANLTFTITGDHGIYIDGVGTTKPTSSITIADTTGLHYIWYNATGTLSTNGFPGFFVPTVASVYWNTTINKGLLGDERHGMKMDGDTHMYLHHSVGVRYESGLTAVFDDTAFTMTGGKIDDEDIEHTIVAPSSCAVLYKNGAADFEFLTAQTSYYLVNGANLRYNNVNALADAALNKYVAVWIFATNDPYQPIVSLIGQREDTTIAEARENNKYESLALGTLPFAEMKILYRVILQNTVSVGTRYVETEDLRSISNLPSGTYVATSHNALTDLTMPASGHPYDVAGGFASYDWVGSTLNAKPDYDEVLQAPATFYVVKTSDYLSNPATFYVVKTSDYLVAPSTFPILVGSNYVLKAGDTMTGGLTSNSYITTTSSMSASRFYVGSSFIANDSTTAFTATNPIWITGGGDASSCGPLCDVILGNSVAFDANGLRTQSDIHVRDSEVHVYGTGSGIRFNDGSLLESAGAAGSWVLGAGDVLYTTMTSVAIGATTTDAETLQGPQSVKLWSTSATDDFSYKFYDGDNFVRRKRRAPFYDMELAVVGGGQFRFGTHTGTTFTPKIYINANDGNMGINGLAGGIYPDDYSLKTYGNQWTQGSIVSLSSVTATKYYGDGSALTGINAGDNLGSHVSTKTITANYGISGSTAVFSGAISASNLSGTNTGDNSTNTQYSGLVTNATHTGDVTGATALTVVHVPTSAVDLSTVTTALSGKQGTGNYITALTGNVTASGPGSVAATIVSVPQNAVNLSTVTTALSGKLDTNGSAASLTSFPTLNQNTTGNAATATALAADPADCSGVNFARGVAASGAAACAQPSDVTGNSATATKLATARNINGVAFDGSANINIATTSYLADGVSLALTGATFSAKSSSVTLQGNTFNGASQLVKLDALSKLPAVDGSQLTNLPSTSGGAVLASTQTFTGANTFSSSVTIGAQPSGVWPMSRVHVSSTAGNYTWTVPAGVGMFKVTCIGGGGAGGTNAAGGGGGGGGTAIKYVYGVAVSSQIAYTVGAAGAAGGNGGTSTFGSYCSASGGSAGGNGHYTNGGPYGVGLTGDLLMSGNGGATGGDIAAVGVQSGSGGASVFGGGGTGVNNGTGTAGGDYGGGGGGGTGAASGGKGAVIIEY